VSNSSWGEWKGIDLVQYLGINALTPNSPPDLAILQNKISYTQINSDGNEGFPENSSGLLITYAHEPGTTYPFQEYQLYRSKSRYYRYWTSEGWSEWENKSNIVIKNINEVDATISIENYSLGVTVGSINSSGNRDGLPNNSSGTLITYKPHGTSISFSYQEFKEYGTHNKYIRYASSGEWTSWKKYALEDI